MFGRKGGGEKGGERRMGLGENEGRRLAEKGRCKGGLGGGRWRTGWVAEGSCEKIRGREGDLAEKGRCKESIVGNGAEEGRKKERKGCLAGKVG